MHRVPLQSIRRQRSGRHPSDTHSTDSGGDGGGPGRLLGAAAAEYTAGLRASRRSNSNSDDAEVTPPTLWHLLTTLPASPGARRLLRDPG